MIDVAPLRGVIYGDYKLDADRAALFVAWLVRRGHELGEMLIKHRIGSCEFNAVWMDAEEFLPAEFKDLQSEFMGVKK